MKAPARAFDERTLTYSDAALSPSTTYYYFVQAAKGGVSSTSSNQASATTSAASTVTKINCGTPLMNCFVT